MKRTFQRVFSFGRTNDAGKENQNQDVDMEESTTSESGDMKRFPLDTFLCGIIEEMIQGLIEYQTCEESGWQLVLHSIGHMYEYLYQAPPQREYRDQFVIENYRMLFQRETMAYRDDVCRGVKRMREGMWVNGDEVEFSNDLRALGSELEKCGTNLKFWISKIHEAGVLSRRSEPYGTDIDMLNKLRELITTFDATYRNFEKSYIEALIKVEIKSRSVVEETACEIEREGHSRATQKILNSFAKLSAKSRDGPSCKYDVKVFEEIYQGKFRVHVHPQLWWMAEELQSNYEEMCRYLVELQPKILRLHPKLEHNVGLVRRLDIFHETYQNVGRWLISENGALSRFCKFVEENGINPSEFDVCEGDWILVVPRLFCLWLWSCREEIGADLQSRSTSELAALVTSLTGNGMSFLQELHRAMEPYQEKLSSLVSMLREIKSVDTSELAKALEPLSLLMQRCRAQEWNCILQILCHSDTEEDKIISRGRLPSI